MNKKITSLWLIAIVLLSVGLAYAQDDKKVKYVYPKATFDQEAAKKALEKGNSTISGTAYTRVYDAKVAETAGGIAGAKKGGMWGMVAGKVSGKAADKEIGEKVGSKKTAVKGTIVTLFPLTPYFEEYLKMRNKSGNSYDISKLNPFKKREVPMISEEAYEYKLTTRVADDKGNFTFNNLKPGRYLIESVVEYIKTGTASEQVGTTTQTQTIMQGNTPIGTNTYEIPVYRYYKVSWTERVYVYEAVDVAQDGSTVKVDLK